MAKTKHSAPSLAWVEAKKRHHLTTVQVRMAWELEMNPKKLGKLANRRQEPWKAPLPEFTERLYVERFKRASPQTVTLLPDRARTMKDKL
jgi:hypothetical protein